MLEINKIYTEDCLITMGKMKDGEVDLIVTSPPFNVGKDYGTEFNDKKPEKDYKIWLLERLIEMNRVAGTAIYIFITSKYQEFIRKNIKGFHQIIYWHRPNMVGKKFHKSWIPTITPIIMAWTNGRKPMLNSNFNGNTFDLIISSSPQTNFTGDKKRVHIAQDPIGIYLPLIARTPGKIVYDPFMGSGTTAIAAQRIKRNYLGSETNKEFVKIANKRLRTEKSGLQFTEQINLITGKPENKA